MEYIINGKIKKMQTLPKIGLYFLFGALWSFSQVGYSFAFLPWFTFIPFIITIKYEDYKYGFFYSLVFGFAVYFFHLWWMLPPFASQIFIELTQPYFYILKWAIAIILYLAICAYHGIVYGFIFLIVRYLSKNNINLFYFCIPVVTTVLDYFFPKLWHDQIGYSQFVFFHFSQIADVFGIPGITFIIICCNSAACILIESILCKKKINYGMLVFLAMIIIVIGSSIYGIFRYRYILKISEKSQKAKIGIVQGNFSGFEKRDNENIDRMITEYNELSEKLIIQKPDLIIWPETAIPTEYNISETDYSEIKKFGDIPLLTGIHLYKDDKKDLIKLYNSVVLISKDKKRIDYYNKRKLVPFVESAPVSFLNIFLKIAGYFSFSPGDENKIMEIGNIKLSPDICYEGINPDYIRKAIVIKGKRANLIVNVTNDSWYGRTIEPMMHLHMTGFRSIENRISLVRCTNSGFSAVFNPTGDEVYTSPLFKKDFVVIEVPLLEIKTIYNKWGWFFIWFLLIFLVIISAIATYRKLYFKQVKSLLIAKKIHKRNLKRMWLE